MLQFDKEPTPPRPLSKPEYYPYSYNSPTKFANWSTDDYEGHIKRLYSQCDALLEYVKRLESRVRELDYKTRQSVGTVAANNILLQPNPNELHPLGEWHEDDGPVLWWRLPVGEPPYVGSPLDDGWLNGYYTHWSKLKGPYGTGD